MEDPARERRMSLTAYVCESKPFDNVHFDGETRYERHVRDIYEP